MSAPLQEIFPQRALAAFDAVHAGILITDDEGHAVFANARMCTLMGVRPSEIHGIDAAVLLQLQSRNADAAHQQRDVRVDVTLSGIPYSLVISTSAIAPHLLLCVVQDITRIIAEFGDLRADLDALKAELAALIANETVPMCMNCRKIRLRDGSWVTAADPAVLIANAVITHGFCPNCAEEYFEELKAEAT